MTYQYYCGAQNLKCGISVSDYEWDYLISKGNRTSCEGLS